MNSRLLPVLAMVAVGALAACKDPSADKPRATVSSAVASQAATPPAAAPGTTWILEPGTSSIEWTGSKVTGKHDGSFTKFSGTVSVPGGRFEDARIAVEIETASLASDSPKLEEHLRSPDFFDVAKFPKASFTSTGVVAEASADGTHRITGNLLLHGVTKSISFPARVATDGGKPTASAEFTINRKDFGLVYPGMPDDLIRDGVVIRLKIAPARSAP